MHGLKNVTMTGTAQVKSNLRTSQEKNSSNPYSAEDQSLQSGSKTESQYEDDFDSISKSHLSKSAAGRTSQTYSTGFEAQHAKDSTPVPQKSAPLQTLNSAADKKQQSAAG